MKTGFHQKYMRLAKQIAESNDICGSRKIGVVIVDPDDNSIISTGYNGPPAGTPHCDSPRFIKNYFWPQLSDIEKETACKAVCLSAKELKERRAIGIKIDPTTNKEYVYFEPDFLADRVRAGTCPRRLINAGSGERSSLCSCQHAERNAITKARDKLVGCLMFCWCGLPCVDCTGAIINSKISEVHCLDVPDYHPVSNWLFQEAKINVQKHSPDSFN